MAVMVLMTALCIGAIAFLIAFFVAVEREWNAVGRKHIVWICGQKTPVRDHFPEADNRTLNVGHHKLVRLVFTSDSWKQQQPRQPIPFAQGRRNQAGSPSNRLQGGA